MRNQKKKNIINIIILSIFIILLIYAAIKYTSVITKLISNPEKFRTFLLSYGNISILVFFLFQILQVVIAGIPGELIQIAGGYVYGTFFGTLYSSIGILLGSVIVLYIVRILGYSVLKLFISEQNLQKFDFLINNGKSETTMFVLFLIPGLPKDIFTYIAGLTPIKLRKFLMISAIARFPGILISSYVGANLEEKRYTVAIIASIIAVLLSITVFFVKDKLINHIKQKIINQKDVS